PPAAGVQSRFLIQNRTIPRDRVANLRGQIVYAGPDNRLWTVGRDAKTPRIVLSNPATGEAPGTLGDLNLAPNGRRLLYSVDADSTTPRPFLLDLDNATLSRQKYNGAWAPDNRHIVASDGTQLVVANVDDGTVETLGDGSNANWTATGDIIAVRQGNIWLIPYPAKNGPARPLTSFPTSGDQVWGFAGRLLYHYSNHILFVGGARDKLGAQGNGLALWSLDVASHHLTQLAVPGGNAIRTLALSPSGTQVAWAEQAHSSACASVGSVGWMRVDGWGKPGGVDLPQADNNFYVLSGLTWTPDQWLIYAGRQASCAGPPPPSPGPDKIYLLNPATPNAPQYLVDGSAPVWMMPLGLGQPPPGGVTLH
ncbi:MAG TPA: hypothetical protein VKY74_08340, partial [Chloroflexia bacterium]|nr:hypothetical protein [Chloroflexia bacterium]